MRLIERSYSASTQKSEVPNGRQGACHTRVQDLQQGERPEHGKGSGSQGLGPVHGTLPHCISQPDPDVLGHRLPHLTWPDCIQAIGKLHRLLDRQHAAQEPEWLWPEGLLWHQTDFRSELQERWNSSCRSAKESS